MITLDDAQKAAVESDAESLVIVAGAGSGKTRVFTARILHIIDIGYSPGRILAMTFTRLAAKEIRERIDKARPGIRGLTIGTFHSVFFKQLNEFAPRVDYKRPITPYDEYFTADILVDEMIAMGLPYSDRAKNEDLRRKEPKTILNIVRLMQKKDRMNWKRLIDAYQRKLKKHNAVGYDEMISLMVRLLENHEDVRLQLHNLWHWILIDEAQDTDPIQMRLIELLDPRHLTAVGDDGQAIYEWRGANPGELINLAQRSKVIHLDTNYRSTKTIIEASNLLLSHNINQIPREIKPTWYAEEGLCTCQWSGSEDTADDAAALAKDIIIEGEYGTGEIAVLCRTNRLAREVSQYLGRYLVPHHLVTRGDFWNIEPVRCIVAHLMLLQNMNNNGPWNKAVNFPFNRLTPLIRAAIKRYAASKRLRYFQATAWLVCNNDPTEQELEVAQWALKFASIAGRYYQSMKDNITWDALTCIENLNEGLGWLQYFKMLPSRMVKPQAIYDRIRLQMKALATEDDPASLNAFIEWYASRDLQDEADQGLPLVTVCTIHAAKGLEWPVVILPGWDVKQFPSKRALTDGRLEEERRLAYVAITRAADHCYILGGSNPSQFTDEAGLFTTDETEDGNDFIQV